MITLKSNLCADGLVLAEMHPMQWITFGLLFYSVTFDSLSVQAYCISSVAESPYKELMLLKAVWLDYRCLTHGSTAL